MNVLLTGAFGNVGTSTLEELIRHGHHVRCFHLKTKANKRTAKRFEGTMEVVWGDLRQPEVVADAVRGQDVVVHLGFIIPKMSATGVESEKRPDWARQINIGGTRHLVNAIERLPMPPKLIFSSSYHVFGQTQSQPPPRTLSDPVRPIEHYSRHKVACERMIELCESECAIFRLAATLPLAIQLDPGMFDVPLSNRMEFVHTRDVGTAIANAVVSDEIWGKTLLIGGGSRCQYIYREIVEGILDAMGVGMLPEEAFGSTPFPTDWVDSTESQRLLDYQERDLEDYIAEMVDLLGFKRRLIRCSRPLVRCWLLMKSPYYRRAKLMRPKRAPARISG